MTDDKSTELHYRQIIKYTGLFGGIQTMNILVGLVRNKLTALLLGPLGMGLVALYQSSVKLVSDSTGLGLGMSGVREISDAYSVGDDGEVERLVKVIRSWSVVAALVGTLLCALLCKVFDSLAYSWGSHTLHGRHDGHNLWRDRRFKSHAAHESPCHIQLLQCAVGSRGVCPSLLVLWFQSRRPVACVGVPGPDARCSCSLLQGLSVAAVF